ncbi:MAG: short chain dehydrogenase [Rhodocyclaceae bacterium]|nr:MAG: short chain dehydrogenase [Rhodocyclaceae bacterium]TND03559.1 MAG: short chain dehydrogenase [Rhodocyclaceae bacterium]
MTHRELKGRVVLITGAAGGLGAALCQRYAAAGARIAALDLDAAKLDTLTTSLHATGAEALALPADITDPAACKSAVTATIAHFGTLDGLINNAGISHRSLLQDTDPDVIRRVMEVNFFGAANLTQAALAQIVARHGFIVAISSVAGFSPLTGRTGYAASKHALHGFFDSLRSEVEGAGVGVTLVCPSFIRTGIGTAATDGSGAPVSSPRITTGGESSPEEIAERIFEAVAQGRKLLLPDATARKAWWLSRLAPGLYARIMKRRVGGEFSGLL